MAARLERHVKRRTGGSLAGSLERDDLGVRPAEPLVMTDAQAAALAYDDCADQRVGLDPAPSSLGLGQGRPHPVDVFILRGTIGATSHPSAQKGLCPIETAASRGRAGSGRLLRSQGEPRLRRPPAAATA